MFDQLFKRALTRARHVTAPFAEERARYLDYCELRGDSRSLQLRKEITRNGCEPGQSG